MIIVPKVVTKVIKFNLIVCRSLPFSFADKNERDRKMGQCCSKPSQEAPQETQQEEKVEAPPKEEEKKEAKPGLNDIVAKYDWPDFAWDFSEDVLNWYYVDHVMTKKEKITHIIDVLNESFDDAPIYAAPLLVYNDEDDSYFYVVGSGEFYNSEYEDFVPIGEQKDMYDAWAERLKQRYIDTKESYFATLKEGAILFNIDEKNLPLQKAKRSKNIGGRACTSYREPYLDAFVKWLGAEFPDSVKVKPQRCMYLELLIRKAVLEKKEGLVWWTPEEWSILNEDEHRKELIKKLK
jgi:hypothetical protein